MTDIARTSGTARVPLDVRLEGLSAPVDPRFLGMTFPAYRHFLDLEMVRRHPQVPNTPLVMPVALGARVGGEPVALAIAEIREGQTANGEVLSLFVAPDFRGRGLGTALLDSMGAYLSRMGVEKVVGVYMTGQPGQQALERVLEKAGWSKPEIRQLTLRFTLEQARRTGWYGKYPLEPGYTVFPWKDLSETEREALRESQRATGWIKPDLEPWKHDAEGFEPVSSLGIRLNGELVGWIINHALDARVVRFTCSFIRKDLGRRGKIVPVYSEAIRRLSETTDFVECTLTAPVRHRGMSTFVLRRCAPVASFLGETRGTFKLLAR
jgi:GNAT superfamily N-acetyltransferase